jgi:hypothetical protein
MNPHPKPQPPLGIEHHISPLALICIVDVKEDVKKLFLLSDCRKIFQPLNGEGGFHIKNVLIGNGDIKTETDDQKHVHSFESEYIPLYNDMIVAREDLFYGLKIVCDRKVDPRAIERIGASYALPCKPVCLVTVDLPSPIGIGYTQIILPADIKVHGRTIVWSPILQSEGNFGKLKGDTPIGEVVKEPDIALANNFWLAHLTVKGNFIWAKGHQELQLNGEAFGFFDGNTNLHFPSGDCGRGGDFEMWFWIKKEMFNGPTIDLPRSDKIG